MVDVLSGEIDDEDARVNRCKQTLAATFRAFARQGFDLGLAGHITQRDFRDPGRFWVNPLGKDFASMMPGDLVLVDHAGNVVHGRGPINHSAYVIHSRIHETRPDVNAVAHAHSTFGSTWSTLGRFLDPVTQGACVFFEDHALMDDYGGPVMETNEGEAVAEELGKKKAIIMRNHGLLTVGATVEEAAWWFIAMERACQTQILAEQVGLPVRIPDQTARRTRIINGSHEAGHLAFRPYLEREGITSMAVSLPPYQGFAGSSGRASV